jgi:pimeloyl-ACP methyl ester carboxylesterase
MRRLLALVLFALASCRAAPIPEDLRYPAGTGFQTRTLIVDGTDLRIIDSGTGTPVVFLHGFGASMYSWRHVLPVVAGAGYRVIAFDNRGFGFSEKPRHGYTNGAYARLAIALLDSLRITSAVFVGHSMGGAIAAEVALRAPDRVRGLVLVDAAGAGVRWPGVLRIARVPFIGAVATTMRGRWITGRILRSTYADPRKVTETDVDQYYAPVARGDYGPALRGVLREFRFDTLVGTGRLRLLQPPTLVLWGDDDRWIKLGDGTRLAREIPRSAFVIIPRAGHTPAEEQPDELNRVLMEFLKEGLSRIPENVAWSSPPSLRSSRSSSSP